jgi:hypothetical protein
LGRIWSKHRPASLQRTPSWSLRRLRQATASADCGDEELPVSPSGPAPGVRSYGRSRVGVAANTFVGAGGVNLLVDARNRLRVTGDDLLIRSPAPILTRIRAFRADRNDDSARTSHTTHTLTGVTESSRDAAVHGRATASSPNTHSQRRRSLGLRG